MGQKANPISLRLPIKRNWSSRWFSSRKFADFLLEDLLIKRAIDKKLTKTAAIQRIEIERLTQEIKIIIYTAKPGIMIGRSGQGITELKEFIKNLVGERRLKQGTQNNQAGKIKVEKINLEIVEIREPELYARLMSQTIALQLEKRIAYRRAVKQALGKIIQKVKGAKIVVSGRLNGAEIARRESFTEGSIPLSSFRSDIDYAQENAYTTYGVIGVKVWIYRGKESLSQEKTRAKSFEG